MHSNRNIWVYLVSLFAVGVTCFPASARMIADDRFGISLNVPDNFQRNSTVTDENTIYQFVEQENDATSDELGIIIQLQRLRSVIDPTNRLQLSDIQTSSSSPPTIARQSWREVTVDVVRRVTVNEGMPTVAYSVRLPLSREAIQLEAIGPEQRDPIVRGLFEQILQSAAHRDPLAQPAQAVAAAPSQATNRVASYTSMIRLGAVAISSLVVVGLLILWVRQIALRRSNGPPTLFT